MKPITKAIIPVGGFGTRMLPATKTIPKEMLPVFDTPVIDFIVQEAIQSGIKDIIIVTNCNKKSVEDYFDTHFELETKLKEKNKTVLLERIQHLHSLANIVYVRQSEALGGGHAILCAAPFVEKDESVVVLFGDDIVANPKGPNAVQQMMSVYEKTGESVVMLQEVADQDVHKYGIVDMDSENRIRGIIEKPKLEDAPSRMSVVGKYILTPNIIQELRSVVPDKTGEIGLPDAFLSSIQKGGVITGCPLEGLRFDTGSPLGYVEAFLYRASQKHPEEMQQFLEKYTNTVL